jgi:hypothetical protein
MRQTSAWFPRTQALGRYRLGLGGQGGVGHRVQRQRDVAGQVAVLRAGQNEQALEQPV